MNVVEARRRLMMMQKQGETWDYVILPDNPDQYGNGKFQTIRINVTAGQTITIQYESIFERAGNCVVDGYFAGTYPYLTYTRDLTSDNGTITLYATKTNYISLGQNRNTAVGTLSNYTIKSIKVKLT